LLQDKCLTIFNPFPTQDPCLSASAAAAAAASPSTAKNAETDVRARRVPIKRRQ